MCTLVCRSVQATVVRGNQSAPRGVVFAVMVCVALVQAVAEFPLFTAVYKISYEGAPVKSIVENLTHL